MKRCNLSFLLIILLFFPGNNLLAKTVPPPLKNVKIQARVTLDGNGIYHYYHTVTNPPENQIGLYKIGIDITLPKYGISPGSPWMEGYAQPDELTPMLALRNGVPYVPVAWKDSALWMGNLNHEDGRWCLIGDTGIIEWHPKYNFSTRFQYLLNPGNTSEELESISYGLPGIRKVVFKPDWRALDLPSEYLTFAEDTLEQNIEADRKLESLGCLGTTIGPTAPPAYNPLQFNQMLQDYVNQSVSLGWLKDSALTQQLNNYLKQVAAALKEKRTADAQNIISQFMNAVQNSNLSQCTTEAYALLYFNAKYFQNKIKVGNHKNLKNSKK